MVGALLISRWRITNFALTGTAAWIVLGAFRAPLGLTHSWLLIALLLAATGMASALTDISLVCLVQQRVPPAHLAKALGVWESGIALAVSASPFFAAAVVAHAGPRAGFVVSGTAITLVGLAAACVSGDSIRCPRANLTWALTRRLSLQSRSGHDTGSRRLTPWRRRTRALCPPRRDLAPWPGSCGIVTLTCASWCAMKINWRNIMSPLARLLRSAVNRIPCIRLPIMVGATSLISTLGLGAGAARARPAPPPPRSAWVFQHDDGKSFCMDLTYSHPFNGDPVHLWQCKPGNNDQRWIPVLDSSSTGTTFRYMLESADDTSYCLDAGYPLALGNRLRVWQCNGGRNQLWTVSPVDPLAGGDPELLWGSISSGNYYCADIGEPGNWDGNPITGWHCYDNPDVKWNVEVQ